MKPTNKPLKNYRRPFAIIAKVKLLLMALVAMIGYAGMAVAGYFPVPLTPNSFTYDIVVESNYPAAPWQDAVNVTMDGGPSLANNTWFEQGLDLQNSTTAYPYGLPHPGTLVTNRYLSDHIFQMPPTYKGSCAVFIGNYTNVPAGFAFGYTNGYFAPVTPAAYSKLSFLLAAGNGPTEMVCVVFHADGTTETNNILAPDWFGSYNSTSGAYTGSNPNSAPNPQFCMTANGRCNTGGYANTGSATACLVWSDDITLTNTTSAVTNIGFAFVANGRASIFAVSGSTGGAFSPIAVTGYDADPVVEATVLPLPYNATMDNGTNISAGGAGANTWYEMGWDTNFPNAGFPVHGSTITSISTGRQYQMAPSYQGPMSILVDTNHQSANITPVTPQAFTAVSLLTCGASIGAANVMTNKIILQHADGVNETNTFLGFDWFNNNTTSAGVPVVVAYKANGRVSFNNARALNNATNLPNMDPRIYESQFQLLDSTSPVTNIVVKYFMAGGGNWTTYVLAMAGSTDPVPVVLFPTQTPAAQNVYAGQSATFGVQTLYGTAPQYQWQVSSSYYGPFSNITDGPTGTGSTISGSTTANLTVANVGASDVKYYTCLVTNSVTTTIQQRTPAPLTLLHSTLPDLFQPGDPISDFGEVVASPAGLTLNNVNDGTMATYLNYGDSGNTTNGPFIGPVGIIEKPNVGSTIVSGIRFVNAINAVTCDPADFMLEGSNDGTNWTTIVADTPLALSDARNLQNTGPINITNQVLQEVDFANSVGYTTYRVTFNNVKTNASANSMQIAEIQLLGSLTSIAPGILAQPSPANDTLYAGATLNLATLGNGPSPLTYQWYFNNGLINGATNSTYSKANIGNGDAGNYYCVLSNPYGSTTSSIVALTVISPSSTYASTVIADHPIAYYPLNEQPDNGVGNNGTAMIDYVGSHDGSYTDVTIGLQGYSANDPNETSVQFGEIDTNASFGGLVSPAIDLSSPTNSDAAFSVEAWVQGNSQVSGYQTTGGAGIVCLGWGGGSETFALDCGGTSNSFRFYFREAGGASVNANASAPVSADGNWHHVVGVLDEPNKKQYLWIDGQVASVVNLATNGMGVLGTSAPTNRFTIGWRNNNNTNGNTGGLQFRGNIDEVAIYKYALTTNQVQNHFLSAGIAPRFTLVPTNITASEGTTVTFNAGAFGSLPLSLQWYNAATGNPIAGQTNSNLVLPNVTAVMNGNQYYLMASNTYGTTNTPVVYLTVVSGPPVLETDVTTPVQGYAGYPVVLSATFGGSQPLTYQWKFNGNNLSDGGRISGAHSNVLTIANSQPGDTGNYQLIVNNTQGQNQSSVAAVTIAPTLGFNGTGAGWTQQGSSAGGLYVGNNALQLTFNNGNEANSTFFGSPVYVGAFEASFLYQVVNPNNPADGICFVVQNDPRGAAALGGGGGSLGVAGVTPSVELEFNIYSAPGIAFNTNGAVGSYVFPGQIIINNGDVIAVDMTYLNGVAYLTLQDTNNGKTFSATANINIPQVVGSSMAYVGFTGADGGAAANQVVSNFQFTSLVNLSAAVSGNNLVLSWPMGVGGYTLQQSSSLSPASWSAVTTAVVQSGGLNQVTVPLSGPQHYYRLVVP